MVGTSWVGNVKRTASPFGVRLQERFETRLGASLHLKMFLSSPLYPHWRSLLLLLRAAVVVRIAQVECVFDALAGASVRLRAAPAACRPAGARCWRGGGWADVSKVVQNSARTAKRATLKRWLLHSSSAAPDEQRPLLSTQHHLKRCLVAPEPPMRLIVTSCAAMKWCRSLERARMASCGGQRIKRRRTW